MEKGFKLISHITIAVVIWKVYKLEQNFKFNNFEKLVREVELYRGDQAMKRFNELENPTVYDALF